MPLKTLTTNFGKLGKEKSFRYDVDFVQFQDSFSNDQYYAFNDLFSFSAENKVNIADLDDDFLYSEISNVSKEGIVNPTQLNFNNRTEEDESYYVKIEKGDIIRVQKNDILLSKVRPNLKKFVLVDDRNKDVYFTSAFIHLKPKQLNKILYYALRTVFFDNVIAISRQGKGYPTLKEDDFLSLKFNKKIIDKLLSKQDEIAEKIDKLEKTIQNLGKHVRQPQEVINTVFAREFGFNLPEFEKLKQIQNYYLNLSSFGNNIDLRQSAKFHREAGIFVNSELKRVTKSKIKDFIVEPIVLGKSVSPKDYDENGNYYYISMANIKNWRFESEDSKLVSTEYSDQNKNKTVAKNDILIARSGEGTIGKVALIEDEDLQGIFADFTMRMRLKDYNPLFAYYYFRTEYFQYLVEINKKGLGNNTNIFPSQIQEFPLIDISLKEQQRIVDEIKTELDKQEDNNHKITLERGKIDQIIEEAVR